MARTKTTPLGEWEIAALLNVKRDTVKQWRQRGLLPSAEFVVNRHPAWKHSTIVAWALATGRIDADDPRLAA